MSSTPWRGVRGPFRIDGLTPQDFEQIPAYAVAPMMQDILEAEHWKTPESTPGEIGRICGLVERLAAALHPGLSAAALRCLQRARPPHHIL